ncbi:transcriptional regulator, CopG family [Staphylothermus marinus F1]|uniref:Transcriptional regulator, CopG family n=1 Tax=Staphylothermus marinus (strain ATCC 43588 / DSM 3639 / JCM 9404 / F1) TaxID=399550 RepID=A3DPU1_STAMF|nr:hypothetical protein [Staphylothermus marinus]ABN70651.1 transcriptional regulator, CopG family [Staphylothermus marinus F1]
MSVVVSIRVPRKLKKLMDEFRDEINWSEEIRRFIEMRIKELRRRRVLREVRRIIEQLPETPVGVADKYVREDRDSY